MGIEYLQNQDLWLPFRKVPVQVGCVFDNCMNVSPTQVGPYHNYWAVDFLPPLEFRNTNGTFKGRNVPIFAAGAGTVIIVSIQVPGTNPQCRTFEQNQEIIAGGGESITSNSIAIDHGGGVFTYYMHLSKILVNDGAQVTKDDVIGNMGTTGITVPCPLPHLHFEKWINVQLDANRQFVVIDGVPQFTRTDPVGIKACVDINKLKTIRAQAFGGKPAGDEQEIINTGKGLITYPEILDVNSWNSLKDIWVYSN